MEYDKNIRGLMEFIEELCTNGKHIKKVTHFKFFQELQKIIDENSVWIQQPPYLFNPQDVPEFSEEELVTRYSTTTPISEHEKENRNSEIFDSESDKEIFAGKEKEEETEDDEDDGEEADVL